MMAQMCHGTIAVHTYLLSDGVKDMFFLAFSLHTKRQNTEI